MDLNHHIILLDADMRRRASISHALSGNAIHVEPFEALDELASAWPRSGTILANADHTAIDELVAAIALAGEWYPVVAFGEDTSPQRVVEAVMQGAVDFIAWPFAASDLLATLERAQMRIHTVGNLQMRGAVARNRIDKLTGREREVLEGVASGLSNRLIAERLEISPRTVEIHRANMLNKLGAVHSSEAIRLAIEASLVA